MNQFLIKHSETREYIYPVTRNSLMIKLECHLEESCKINLIYWKRFHEDKKKTIKLESFDYTNESHYYYCQLELDEPVRYLNYCFEITCGTETKYYTTQGLSNKYNENYFEYQSTSELDVFQTPKWAKGIVGYHIFPDRFQIGGDSKQVFQNWDTKPDRTSSFGGDLEGIIKKLDYLAQLGIQVIFLTPIFTSHSNHKYDTINYFEIDPSFGTIEELKKLVKEAHDKQIRIILDGVFNHIGYYSEQFQDVIQNGQKSPYWNWFYINGEEIDVEHINYECVGDYKWMPKLRYSSPELRAFMLKVATYWINEANIDGWRLDVADEVDYTFWQDFRKATKLTNDQILLTGETWHDGRDLLRGDQLDSIMNYRFRSFVIEFFIKKQMSKEKFKEEIEKLLFAYPIQTRNILYNLLGSHDTQRILTVCQTDITLFKMVVAFQMTYPGMPVIYYGDEIGTEGETDPDCRTTMKWNAIDSDILEFYQMMTKLRRDHKALTLGDFKHLNLNESVYGYVRKYQNESVIVLFNTSDTGKNLSFDLSMFKINTEESQESRHIKLHVPAQGFRIIEINEIDLEIRFEFLV